MKMLPTVNSEILVAVSACFFFVCSLAIWNSIHYAKAINEFRELVEDTKKRITKMQEILYEELERKDDE